MTGVRRRDRDFISIKCQRSTLYTKIHESCNIILSCFLFAVFPRENLQGNSWKADEKKPTHRVQCFLITVNWRLWIFLNPWKMMTWLHLLRHIFHNFPQFSTVLQSFPISKSIQNYRSNDFFPLVESILHILLNCLYLVIRKAISSSYKISQFN